VVFYKDNKAKAFTHKTTKHEVAQREIFFFVKLCALCGFVAKKSSMLIRGLTFGADRYVFEQDWIAIFK
jgi:hypothetical protein